jgi:hypothetical protein
MASLHLVPLLLLLQPYMREAWRVEPMYAQHKGQCLDELLVQLLMHGRALELDAAIDKCSKTPGSSPGLSPSSSMEELLPGSEAMAAAEGLLAGHVFPVYPGPAAGGWGLAAFEANWNACLCAIPLCSVYCAAANDRLLCNIWSNHTCAACCLALCCSLFLKPPAFSPVCTNVETLRGGRAEGYRAVNRLMSALASLEVPAMAGGMTLQ